MTHKRRMHFALVSTVVVIAAALSGAASPLSANADPASPSAPAVSVPLNTPFASPTATSTITSASTKPDKDGWFRLDLGIKVEATGADSVALIK